MQHPNVRGAIFALAGFGLYSVQDLFVKLLGERISAIQILFFVALFGLPMAALINRRELTRFNLRPKRPGWAVVRAVSSALAGATGFYAFAELSMAQVYSIIFAAPLLITILSIPLLGETVRLRRWLAVLVGLCGVLIVLRPGSAPLGAGHIAALAAAVGIALFWVLTRKLSDQESNIFLLMSPLAAMLVTMGLALPFVYTPMTFGETLLMLLTSMTALVAMQLTINAYRIADAVIVAPMQYSQMLWAVLFGAVIFADKLDGATVLGASIIIASGIYIVVREARMGQAPTA